MVFDLQEQLAELRAGQGDASGVRRARAGLVERLDTLVAGLTERYASAPQAAAPPALAELKRMLSDIAYLRTLLRDVDVVLAG
jgi:hypothetical protein